MNNFLIFMAAYFSIGILFGWFWYFKKVWRGCDLADVLFYVILIVVWPFPFMTEIGLKR